MRLSIAILMWVLSCVPAFAATFDYSAFARLPVQHEGRIKPMETFATIHLKRFHGGETIGNKSATAWLVQALFDPASAVDEPLFLIKGTDTQVMLGLAPRQGDYYNFAETSQAIADNSKLIKSLLGTPDNELSPAQRAVLRVYENNELFTQITLANTLFLALGTEFPDAFKARVGIDKNAGSLVAFIDYYKYLPELQKAYSAVQSRKNGKPSAAEQQWLPGVEKIIMTDRTSRANGLLRVIPPQWGGGDMWLSPWAVLHLSQGSPQAAELMGDWRGMANAYQAHNPAQFNKTSLALSQKMQTVSGVRPAALLLERAYWHLDPLQIAWIFYALGLISLVFSFTNHFRYGEQVAWMCISFAIFAQTLAFVMRIYILQRAPVGTLYESMIFVSLVAACFGLYVFYKTKHASALLIAAFTGGSLLILSQNFAGEDTMNMLIAVLNTQFWLITHVLCVTAGYGFSIVASLYAHGYLWASVRKFDAEKIQGLSRSIYATAIIALFFMVLGTMLGGVWADQSWGRFWGWDPKENGALLICLWLIWALHGRISGHFGERGFAAVMVLLNIIVALSWLGVNLLATGLHSYGFTDRAAWGLGVFCLLEVAFAGMTYALLWRRKHAA